MSWHHHRTPQHGGSAPATPGFNAVAPEWLVYGAAAAAPAVPAAESTLGSHPCVALSSAQVLPEWTTSTSPCNDFSSNGVYPLNFVSHSRGSLHRLGRVPEERRAETEVLEGITRVRRVEASTNGQANQSKERNGSPRATLQEIEIGMRDRRVCKPLIQKPPRQNRWHGNRSVRGPTILCFDVLLGHPSARCTWRASPLAGGSIPSRTRTMH